MNSIDLKMDVFLKGLLALFLSGIAVSSAVASVKKYLQHRVGCFLSGTKAG